MESVKERYAGAAKAQEPALCCPIDYDPKYLEIIPDEVIARDYGCGDPSRYVREGDTVLDLGAGGGKICFIAAQIVGPEGRVIGVDMTDEMLDLARSAQPTVVERIGYDNIDFRHGRIEDLRTDLDLADAYLQKNPVRSAADYKAFEDHMAKMRVERPLVADDSIDLIVSNCVLNLVGDEDKRALFAEMHRVLKIGGRIAVSDIVSDEPSPQHLKDDPELWSGCISGAMTEKGFLAALEDAGFYGMAIDKYAGEAWQVIDGIEYRSVTITAYKGKEGYCWDKNQAVIYKGPWKQVEDDDGHTYARGERMAVCEKTYRILTSEPYGQDMIGVEPAEAVSAPIPFDCARPTIRDPRETKSGAKPAVITNNTDACDTPDCC